jgi:hypothetical protein
MTLNAAPGSFVLIRGAEWLACERDAEVVVAGL